MKTKDLNISFKDINLSKKEVAGYFANFSEIDSYNEITNKGAFTKTIAENGPGGKNLIRWCLNHDMEQPLGSFLLLQEDDFGLFYQGALGEMKDAKELRHMIDCGININHSYGYRTIKEAEREDGVNVLYEVKMYEGSCLSTWAANWNTPLVPVISTEGKSIRDHVEVFQKAINPYIKYKSISEAEDKVLEDLENWIGMQTKTFYDSIEPKIKEEQSKDTDLGLIAVQMELLKIKSHLAAN